MGISFNLSNSSSGFQPKRKKFGLGSLTLLLLAGLVFLGTGLTGRSAATVDPGWTRISGRVIGASTHATTRETNYAAIVQYTVSGKKYQVTSSISSSAYPSIGASQEVAYNPAHPDDAKVVESTGTDVWIDVIIGVGLLILVMTPVAFVRSLQRSNTINRLLREGQKRQGVLVDIRRIDGSLTNRRTANPVYRLIVSATDFTGTVQTYKSDLITGGLGSLSLIDFRAHPVPIDVYVSSANPQDYYVDISKLPNLTPEYIARLANPQSPSTLL